MTLPGYLAYRIAVPMFLSMIMVVAIVVAADLTPLDPGALLLSAVAAAPMAPLYALALAVLAENKVQGFALSKASGVFMMPALLAYFVPAEWQLVLGLSPVTWTARLFWALAAGDPAGARREFEEAAKLSAADEFLAVRAGAYAGLGRAFKAQGDHEGAARHFLSVGILFDDPTLVPECLYEAAMALQKAGKSEDSARVLQELAQRYPDSVWAKKGR